MSKLLCGVQFSFPHVFEYIIYYQWLDNRYGSAISPHSYWALANPAILRGSNLETSPTPPPFLTPHKTVRNGRYDEAGPRKLLFKRNEERASMRRVETLCKDHLSSKFVWVNKFLKRSYVQYFLTFAFYASKCTKLNRAGPVLIRIPLFSNKHIYFCDRIVFRQLARQAYCSCVCSSARNGSSQHVSINRLLFFCCCFFLFFFSRYS